MPRLELYLLVSIYIPRLTFNHSINHFKMKTLPPPPPFLTFLLIVFFVFPFEKHAFAQSDDCNVRATISDYQMAIEQLPDINRAAEEAPPNAIANVPVRIYVVLKDDGTSGSTIDQSVVDNVLANLSAKFSTNPDYNFNFQLCGEVNYIYNSSFYDETMPVDEYAWVSQAVNVYITEGSTPSQSDFPWLTTINNRMYIRSHANFNTATVPHEFGHQFGLLHIFAPEVAYQVPADPNDASGQSDHPYNGGGHPRELVIRETDNAQVYPTPNHGGPPYDDDQYIKGGDLVGDTPAACKGNSQSTHPGCSFSNCNYTGTYLDYNGMPIDDPNNITAINLMSVNGVCRVSFTNEQLMRAYGYYDDVRRHQYWQYPLYEVCGNVDDRVEYKGTSHGINRVAIEFQQTNDKIMKALTNNEGDFDGIVYQYAPPSASVTSSVMKLGSQPDFSFTYEDWIDGITTFDIVIMRKHILGINIMDGYDQVAADVNKSGAVTTADIVLVRKLILGQISSFPDFDQPWRFIPEFVTLNHPSNFDDGEDDNPFQYELDGTEPYQLTPPKQGFDAVKIGDVNNTNSEGLNGQTPEDEGTPIFVTINKSYDGTYTTYDFLVDSFTNVVAYQMEIEFTPDFLEFVRAEPMDLVGVNQDFFDTTQTLVKTLWYDTAQADALTLPDGAGIFRLVFNGDGTNPLSDVLLSENVGFRASMEKSPKRNFAYAPDGSKRPIVFRKYHKGPIATVRVIPNPFSASFRLLIEAVKNEPIEVLVFDAFGRQVMERQEYLHKGSNYLEYNDLDEASPGMYYIQLATRTESIVQKVVKSF